jgi:precorrin-6B methylase 2
MLKFIGPSAFSKLLIKSEKSVTYGKYCELVYGKNLSQFNMLDVEQLDKMLELASFDQHSHILDIGCAVGTISEYISDQTQAKITGIDYAGGAIKRACQRSKDKKHRVNFLNMNMNDLKLSPENTLLGKALTTNNLQFTTVDFIESEIVMLQKALEAVEILKDDFEKEKNINIYYSRKREATNLVKHHQEYPGYRYLYVVSK